jgi:hypothetical protein
VKAAQWKNDEEGERDVELIFGERGFQHRKRTGNRQTRKISRFTVRYVIRTGQMISATLFPQKVGDELQKRTLLKLMKAWGGFEIRILWRRTFLVILATECHNLLMEYGIKCALQLFEEIFVSRQLKGKFQQKLFNNMECQDFIRASIISIGRLS